jgi:hypothetical protein
VQIHYAIDVVLPRCFSYSPCVHRLSQSPLNSNIHYNKVDKMDYLLVLICCRMLLISDSESVTVYLFDSCRVDIVS